MRLAIVCIIVVTVAYVIGCGEQRPILPPGNGLPAATAGPAHRSTTLIVFAGAAGQPALEEAGARYEAQTGTRIEYAFGGSGTMLTQVINEQYGDVYMPGSDDFMDKAEADGAVVAETRAILAYLVPTICVAKGNPLNIAGLEDLLREDVRVVIAQAKAVCLGDIAEQILQRAGLLERVKLKLASFAASCPDTCNMLLLGEADAIIGWDVFARQHPDEIDLVPIPRELARPRNIPAAVITWSTKAEAAAQFIEYLQSDQGKAIFRKHGYTVEWHDDA